MKKIISSAIFLVGLSFMASNVYAVQRYLPDPCYYWEDGQLCECIECSAPAQGGCSYTELCQQCWY